MEKSNDFPGNINTDLPTLTIDTKKGVKRKKSFDDYENSHSCKIDKKYDPTIIESTNGHYLENNIESDNEQSRPMQIMSPPFSEDSEVYQENGNGNDAPTVELLNQLSEFNDRCERPAFQVARKSSKQKIHFNSFCNEFKSDKKFESNKFITKRNKNKRKNIRPKKKVKIQVSADQVEASDSCLTDAEWLTDDESDEFTLTIDESKKKKKEKLSSISIPKEVMEVIVKSGIDDALEEKASKRKLTATHVKNIIKHIVTDENVCQMFKNSILGIGDDQPSFEPKLTRAKTKELIEKQLKDIGACASPWMPTNMDLNSSVAPAFPDTMALITTEFPEEEDDEEYQPELDEQVLSDEESDVFKYGTPNSTRSTILMTPNSASNTSKAFSTPRTPQLNVINLPFSKSKDNFVQRSLDFSTHNEKLEQIGSRTRSKYPMTDTPLEYLESLLNAPDATPDLYYTGCDNEDYLQFLSSFVKTPENNEEVLEDDEQLDPEYNILQDVEGEIINEEAIREEMRMDKGVKVTKIEYNAMIENFLDNFDDDLEDDNFDGENDQENEIRHQENNSYFVNSVNQSQIYEKCNNQFQLQMPEEVQEVWEPPVTVTYLIPQFSQHQIKVLKSQLALHAQLLATSVLNTDHRPLMNFIKDEASKMLNNMLEEGKLSNPNGVSLFHPKNLLACIEAVEIFENKKSESSHVSEQEVIDKDYLSRDFERNTGRLEGFPPYIKDIYLNSTAFIYPQYLTPGLFHGNVLKRLGPFRISEYWLLAMCFKELITDFESIKCQHLTTNQELYDLCKKIGKSRLLRATGHQIFIKMQQIFLKNLRYRTYEENPVIIFFKTGDIELPPAEIYEEYKQYPCCVKNILIRDLPNNFKRYVRLYRKQLKISSRVEMPSIPNSVQNIVVIQDAYGTKIILPPNVIVPNNNSALCTANVGDTSSYIGFPSYSIYRKAFLNKNSLENVLQNQNFISYHGPTSQNLERNNLDYISNSNNLASHNILKTHSVNRYTSTPSITESIGLSNNCGNKLTHYNPVSSNNSLNTITNNNNNSYSYNCEAQNSVFFATTLEEVSQVTTSKESEKINSCLDPLHFDNQKRTKKTNKTEPNGSNCSPNQPPDHYHDMLLQAMADSSILDVINESSQTISNFPLHLNAAKQNISHDNEQIQSYSVGMGDQSVSFFSESPKLNRFMNSSLSPLKNMQLNALLKSPKCGDAAEKYSNIPNNNHICQDTWGNQLLNSPDKFNSCPSLSSFFGSPTNTYLISNKSAVNHQNVSSSKIMENFNGQTSNGEEHCTLQKNGDECKNKARNIKKISKVLFRGYSKENSNVISLDDGKLKSKRNQSTVQPKNKSPTEHVVRDYIIKVKDALYDDRANGLKFQQFMLVIQKLKSNPHSFKKLFTNIKQLFLNHQYLIDDFVIFLNAQQAEIIEKSAEFDIMNRTRFFIKDLELEEGNLTNAHKISQIISVTKKLFKNHLTTRNSALNSLQIHVKLKDLRRIIEKHFADYPKTVLKDNKLSPAKGIVKTPENANLQVSLMCPMNKINVKKIIVKNKMNGCKETDSSDGALNQNFKYLNVFKCNATNERKECNKYSKSLMPKSAEKLNQFVRKRTQPSGRVSKPKSKDSYSSITIATSDIIVNTPSKNVVISPIRYSSRLAAKNAKSTLPSAAKLTQKSIFDLETSSSGLESHENSPIKIYDKCKMKSPAGTKVSSQVILSTYKTRSRSFLSNNWSNPIEISPPKQRVTSNENTCVLKLNELDSSSVTKVLSSATISKNCSLKETPLKYAGGLKSKSKAFISDKEAAISKYKNSPNVTKDEKNNITKRKNVINLKSIDFDTRKAKSKQSPNKCVTKENDVFKIKEVEETWSQEEDFLLLSLMKEEGLNDKFFSTITEELNNKSIKQIQSRIDTILKIMENATS